MTVHARKVTFKARAWTDWNAREQRLDAAHEEVRSMAISGGQNGVLVTRHGHDSFTVAVSPLVPFGMTYEQEESDVREV